MRLFIVLRLVLSVSLTPFYTIAASPNATLDNGHHSGDQYFHPGWRVMDGILPYLQTSNNSRILLSAEVHCDHSPADPPLPIDPLLLQDTPLWLTLFHLDAIYLLRLDRIKERS